MNQISPIFNYSKQKVEIIQLIEQLKRNKQIVFTNGCFDLIHTGHLKILNGAKALGEILIVGLNSDKSVKILKGKNRPIINQFDRSIVLSNFRSVDYVVIFDEETPLELIKTIQPDILVKGGDYTIDQIIGSDIVKLNGGKTVIIPFEKGKSTSNILKRIVEL